MAAPIRVVNKKTGAAYDLHGPGAKRVLEKLQGQGFTAVGTPLPSGSVEAPEKKETTPPASAPPAKPATER